MRRKERANKSVEWIAQDGKLVQTLKSLLWQGGTVLLNREMLIGIVSSIYYIETIDTVLIGWVHDFLVIRVRQQSIGNRVPATFPAVDKKETVRNDSISSSNITAVLSSILNTGSTAQHTLY